MKKYSLIIWCILLPLYAFSQPELMPVFKSGKWAALDTNLKLVTSYEYDDLYILKDKFICAKKGQYYGLITGKQEVVLPFEFEHIKNADNEFLIVKKNGLWGIKSTDGSSKLDCAFKNIRIPKHEIAILETEHGVCFYNFANKTKSTAYDNIGLINNDLLLLKKDETQKLYDYKSNSFSKGFSNIQEKSPGLFFCTSADRINYVLRVNNGFSYATTEQFSFFPFKKEHLAYGVNDSLRIIDKNGRLIKVIKANSIYHLSNSYIKRSMGTFFSENYFAFEKDGKKGLLTDTYQKLLKAEYDEIKYSDSVFFVYNGMKRGLIGKDGTIILPARYSYFRAESKYWMVRDGAFWGAVLPGGKEIIKTQYDKVSLAFGNSFIVNKDSKTGVLNVNGNIVLPLKKQKISTASKCFIIEKDSLFGLAGINGKTYFSPKYKELKELNPDYFAYTENKKVGIISTTGNVIIKPQFRTIFATENRNLFTTQSFKHSYSSLAEIKRTFNLDIYIPKNDITKKRYKTGIINIYGQVLLEPQYFDEQITTDFQGNTIIIRRESSVLVISFDQNGKLEDKTSYKNYVFVQPAYFKSKRNYWEKAGRKRNFYYGLFSPRGRTILDYRFKAIRTRFLNHPNLVRTTSPYGKYGIVNERTGKTILEDVYKVIFTNDLQKGNVIRCVKSSGRAALIDSSAKIILKSIAYIDNFEHSFARVNIGGKLTYQDDFSHKLYINPEINVVPKRKEGQEGRDVVCKKGKWGIIDRNGSWVIKPKYQFLQSFANGVFIAKRGIKWGVISPNDDVLIDFMYDELRYFSDSSVGNWAEIPFYKVRLKEKWGIIDSNGNIIVPIEFSDIEHLISKRKTYFKTIVDKGKVVFGLVNKKGEIVLEPKYEFIDQFKGGFAKLKLKRKNWKYVNRQMQVFPAESFIQTKNFNEKLAAVKTRKGWGFIDEQGNQIIPCRYSDVGNFNEGLAKAKIHIPAKMFGMIKSKRVYALIDKRGSIVYNTNSRVCGDVSNGMIVVKKGQKYQLVTVKGKKVLPGSYDRIIESPKYQLYGVKNRGKGAALYNGNAKLIVPFGKYNDFSAFSEGLCFVNGKEQGFVDTNGVMRIKLECKEAKNFHESMAAIKLAKGWGYIDSTGSLKIEAQFNFAWDFKNGIAKVKDKEYSIYYINKKGQKVNVNMALATNNNYRVISEDSFNGIENNNGQLLVYPAAKEVGLFSQGYAPVGIRKRFGLFSSDGKLLTTPNYMIIKLNKAGYIKLTNLQEVKFIK